MSTIDKFVLFGCGGAALIVLLATSLFGSPKTGYEKPEVRVVEKLVPKYAFKDKVRFKLDPFYRNCKDTTVIVGFYQEEGQIFYDIDEFWCGDKLMEPSSTWYIREEQVLEVLND